MLSAWASADLPGKHPYYLHAPSDLWAARWMLQHRPGNPTVSANEDVAITEINKAIGAIKHAPIDDGKNIDDHPQLDVPPDGRGRLVMYGGDAYEDDLEEAEPEMRWDRTPSCGTDSSQGSPEAP